MNAATPDGVRVDFTAREGFRTEIQVEPGHAIRRTRGDGQNYGIGAMKLRFLLHGPAATVQFLVSTGIVPEQKEGRFGPVWTTTDPMGYDVGYHADAPQYEGHEGYGAMSCEHRPAGKCFYDGSGLLAEKYVPILLMDGHGGIFQALQEYYEEREWVTA